MAPAHIYFRLKFQESKFPFTSDPVKDKSYKSKYLAFDFNTLNFEKLFCRLTFHFNMLFNILS